MIVAWDITHRTTMVIRSAMNIVYSRDMNCTATLFSKRCIIRSRSIVGLHSLEPRMPFPSTAVQRMQVIRGSNQIPKYMSQCASKSCHMATGAKGRIAMGHGLNPAIHSQISTPTPQSLRKLNSNPVSYYLKGEAVPDCKATLFENRHWTMI